MVLLFVDIRDGTNEFIRLDHLSRNNGLNEKVRFAVNHLLDIRNVSFDDCLDGSWDDRAILMVAEKSIEELNHFTTPFLIALCFFKSFINELFYQYLRNLSLSVSFYWRHILQVKLNLRFKHQIVHLKLFIILFDL